MRIRNYSRTFEGTPVHFCVYYPEGGIARRVAFLCSPLGDCACWDRVCTRMCALGALCVAIEMPGFGTNPPGAPQNNTKRAQICWGVLDEVERMTKTENSRWHLVSHGSACGIVLEMTCTYTDSVISRTLISPVTNRFMSRVAQTFIQSKPGRYCLYRAFMFMAGNYNRLLSKLGKLYGGRISYERARELYRQIGDIKRFDTVADMLENGYRNRKKAYAAQNHILFISGSRDSLADNDISARKYGLVNIIENHSINTSSHMLPETHPRETADFPKGWFDYSEGRIKQPKRLDTKGAGL